MSFASPRDNYLDACSVIADAFSADGFKYAKSGPRMTRKIGKLSEVVAFQSSTRNSPSSVALTVHVQLLSPAVLAFRKASQSPGGEHNYIGGDEIGNMSPRKWWSSFDLAGSNRDATLKSIIADIRDVALPFLAQAHDLDALAKMLTERDVRGFMPAGAYGAELMVEYFLASGRPEQAQSIFTAWCNRHAKAVRGREGYGKEARELAKHYKLVQPA